MALNLIPQFGSDYMFSTDFGEILNSSAAVAGGIDNGAIMSAGCGMWDEEIGCPTIFDNGGVLDMVAAESDIVLAAPVTFPERLGISSDLVVPVVSEFGVDFGGGIGGMSVFGAGGYQPGFREFGDECCGLVPDFKPIYPAAGESRGIQGNRTPPIEESNIKVGRYSVEERKDRILRYMKKRNQRNFNKTIKYACRKTLADRRVRVRGRFARNNSESSEEEMVVKKINNPQLEKESYNCDNIAQIKRDEEEWLQEAMASLVYVPYVTG